MALARVQATGKVVADNVASVALTFATPPTVGNGIVVLVVAYSSGTFPAGGCTDNRGNSYALAVTRRNGNANVAIYYCGAVATSSAPFTITVALAGTYYVATAVEVSGVGTGLAVDQTTSTTGSTTTVSTGTTAALTASESLLVAVQAGVVSESFITVEVVSPTWTQEAEELSSAHAVGEADSRIVTGAGTASCSWTQSATTTWAAAVGAFKAGGPAALTGTGSVSLGAPALAGTGALISPARATQLVVEVLNVIPPAPLAVSQVVTEILFATPNDARVTQVACEILVVPRRVPAPRLIRRLRRAPHVAGEDAHRRVFYEKFALDLERGVGLMSGQGSDPLVTLRLSRDGGQTWGEPVTMRAGKLGEYTTRVLARRLGHARDAVFEVTVSDPIAWSLVQAWLDVTPGVS